MKKRILIIEDDFGLASALRVSLEKNGYEVLTSSDGESGYNEIVRNPPDLVVLDILLPKLFGLELLAMVRNHKDKKVSSVPVVVATNFPEEEYLNRANKLGAKKFIVKSSYSLEEIGEMIKNII